MWTRIPLWNSWPAQNDGRFCDLFEKLGEKIVFAAEALEHAVSVHHSWEGDRDRTRCAALRGDADEIVREVFLLLNQSRTTRLSREQTRTLTRAMAGIFDAVHTASEGLPMGSSQAPDHAALAMTLRRSAEQLRLAVSGLREPSDPIGVLNPCAHVHALKRMGDGLVNPAGIGSDPAQAGMMRGIEHCLEAAQALESAFGISPHQRRE